MSKSKGPRPESQGQGTLEGLQKVEPLNLTQQLTFAGALSYPENWGVEPQYLDETMQHHMHLMSPERIESTLVDVSTGSSCAVSYLGGTGLRRIALTPVEYSFIPRNPKAIGEVVLNRTLASRMPADDFTKDIEAAQRSQGYAARGYIEKIDTYVRETLELDRDQLQRFQRYVGDPHLRRLRGDNLKIQMEWVRGHIFEDMIVAMRQQRDWTPEQEAMARRALDARLFLDRNNNKYLSNWQNMLSLAESYTGEKWALFKTKQQELKKFTRK